jgi:hypothetical protein
MVEPKKSKTIPCGKLLWPSGLETWLSGRMPDQPVWRPEFNSTTAKKINKLLRPSIG